MRKCPNCGGRLYEDASEEIMEKDSNFILDAFLAYVCERGCGYVQRIELIDEKEIVQDKPNIFTYATQELSQDAFLCWLFEHLKLRTKDVPYIVAKNLLQKMVAKSVEKNPDILFEKLLDASLTIDKQKLNIDVLLTFSLRDSDEKVYIIIEDKTSSGESRKSQLEHYRKKLEMTEASGKIILVLFKTDYVTEEMEDQYISRDIAFIGYEDIYDVFSPSISYLKEDVILHSWWLHFYDKYYKKIKQSETLLLEDTMTLDEWNDIIKENNYVRRIVFEHLAEYIFRNVSENFLTKTFKSQGKGHIDWHYELTKTKWKHEKMSVSLFFIKDKRNFSFVVKTAPVPYRPQNKISKESKEAYFKVRDKLKKELKKNQTHNWKITNHYLQIAYIPVQNNLPLHQLKTNLDEEVRIIANELDRMMELKQFKQQ